MISSETSHALSAEQHAPTTEQSAPPRKKRKRLSVRLICVLLLCVFPAYCFGAVALHFLCYRLEIHADPNGAVSPAAAAPFEQPVRDALKPALTRKYGLKDFDVKYTRPGWFIGERRICNAGWNDHALQQRERSIPCQNGQGDGVFV